MDPVTHAVIGMAVSELAGAGSVTDPAAIGAMVGAVAPDLDILLQKWGDVVYLKNHRGATHSLPGLAIAAFVIAAALKLIFPPYDFGRLLLFTAAGCLSHTLADLFNCYGAKLLWPMREKKFSINLISTFDPIFIGTLIGFCFSGGALKYLFLALFTSYMLFRGFMRLTVKRRLWGSFGGQYGKISLLPSVAGLFRWHFILESDSRQVIGEMGFISGEIKILRKLRKPKDEVLCEALDSPVGTFFSEFTPLFHIAVEKPGEITRYVFIDLRYFIRNNFLHHAVLEINHKKGTVLETFNPYSMNRSNVIVSRQ